MSLVTRDRETTFVLGAQDPEMREIERVVREAGFARVHAASDGRRCTPMTAYAADGVVGKVLASKGESLAVDQPIVEFET